MVEKRPKIIKNPLAAVLVCNNSWFSPGPNSGEDMSKTVQFPNFVGTKHMMIVWDDAPQWKMFSLIGLNIFEYAELAQWKMWTHIQGVAQPPFILALKNDTVPSGNLSIAIE